MRLKAQRLYPRASSAREVARAVCGVNAQSKPAMMLSLRARLCEAEMEDLSRLIDGRTLVRTWALRGTLHLLCRDDANLILPLVGPVALAKTARRRRELGLDDEKLARGLREIRAALEAESPLTREELVDRLNDRGLGLELKSQAPYHLIASAGLEGVIVLGQDTPAGEQTYVLADHRTVKPESRDEALAELARRYFKGYGPATAADFAAWSGLPAADAKKGWAHLEEHGRPDTGPALDDTVVNLLPAFDTIILGYADRELIVPAKHYGDVYHGGQTVPVILVDGEAAGVWRYEIKGRRIRLEARPFTAFDGDVKDLVGKEAEDIGRFFGLAPKLVWKA